MSNKKSNKTINTHSIEAEVSELRSEKDNLSSQVAELQSVTSMKRQLKSFGHCTWYRYYLYAFRQLKYAVGMMNFHAKKVEYIKQEIFAKLIVHNFSEIIASHTSISKNS